MDSLRDADQTTRPLLFPFHTESGLCARHLSAQFLEIHNS